MFDNRWVTWLVILFGVILLIGIGQLLVLTLFSDPETPPSPPPSAPPEGAGPDAQAIGLSTAQLPEMLQLGADWCPVCRRMKPIISELRKDYKGRVEIVYIDVDKQSKTADKYKVNAIPVQVFINSKGKQVLRHEGFWDKKSIEEQFRKMGIKK